MRTHGCGPESIRGQITTIRPHQRSFRQVNPQGSDTVQSAGLEPAAPSDSRFACLIPHLSGTVKRVSQKIDIGWETLYPIKKGMFSGIGIGLKSAAKLGEKFLKSQ